ncbi:MAG: amidohydrolase family protein [Akkermansiaceae bacterium]|nr:amidohydrolase family protein [Akkermansiaceae bacterium]
MIIRASLLDTPSPGNLRHYEDGVIIIDEHGVIAAAGASSDLLSETLLEQHDVFEAPADSRLLCVPGLIDIHTHLPQYPVVARREDALLPWLERHIFPTELDFQGPGQRSLIEAFFEELAANGTTTVVLYSAVWEDSTALAFEVAAEKGVRAVIGKIMMDEGSYGEPHPLKARRKSLEETTRLAKEWHGANKGLLDYAVSPRFAVTCSIDLMKEAATVAKDFDCYIQTHLSENDAEIEKVRERFPDNANYTDVYREAGLLGEKTILGHAIHLSDPEIDLLAFSGARVAHCPTANFFLNSGLCPVHSLRSAGIPVGLGSDVAAGPELNLWQVMRSAIETQGVRRMLDDSIPGLTPADAIYLATLGGASVLGKDKIIGSLDQGKEADLLLLDLNHILPLDGRFSGDLDPQDIATTLVYRGGPQATVATFTRGRQMV